MNTRLKNRCLSYYSSIFSSVYEIYKLKASPCYAIQRYSSWDNLADYGMIPTENSYELYECGLTGNNLYSTDEIEELIQEKNSIKKNTISVGDILNIFCAGIQRTFFVDSVGLKILNSFFHSPIVKSPWCIHYSASPYRLLDPAKCTI